MSDDEGDERGDDGHEGYENDDGGGFEEDELDRDDVSDAGSEDMLYDAERGSSVAEDEEPPQAPDEEDGEKEEDDGLGPESDDDEALDHTNLDADGPEGEAPAPKAEVGDAEALEAEPDEAEEAAPKAESTAGFKAVPRAPEVNTFQRSRHRSREVKIVAPEDRVTDNRLHRSEAAYIIAKRAEQIAQYATSFTDATGLHDPVAIAFKELFDRRCPLRLRRQVGTGPAGELIVEEWNPREMVLPPLTAPAGLSI